MSIITKLFSKLSGTNSAVVFGGVNIPSSYQNHHFAILGKTRSGKSLTLKTLLRGALESGSSALVYDSSSDLIPLITGTAPKGQPVIVLNPYDARSWYWAAEEDIEDDQDALAFAATLVPDGSYQGSSSEEFFRGHAAGLIGATLCVFTRRRRTEGFSWNLRDLVQTVLSAELLQLVTSHYADTRSSLDFLREGRTLDDSLATVQNAVNGIRPIAASWDRIQVRHPDRKFSFNRWSNNGSGIVVLGVNKRSPEPLIKVNQVLFERATGALLSRHTRFGVGNDDAPLTWVIVDEAANGRKNLPRLLELLAEGAKYGVAVTLATQSAGGFEEAYGKASLGSVLAQCHHLAVFASDRETAEWCSREFGDFEKRQVNVSVGHEPERDSVSVQRHWEPRVPPTLIQDLPIVKEGKPLVGFYRAPSFQRGIVFKQSIKWGVLMRWQPKADPNTKTFEPLPPDFQVLRDLAVDEFSRLSRSPVSL